MIFRPELAEKVLAGEKTLTRRRVSENPRSPWWRGGCALELGRTYAVQAKRGTRALARVRITDVRQEALLHVMRDDDVVREGFAHLGEFVLAWSAMHGEWHWGEPVWRVEFELCG